MKDDYAINSHYLTNTFLLFGRVHFLILGVKGYQASEAAVQLRPTIARRRL